MTNLSSVASLSFVSSERSRKLAEQATAPLGFDRQRLSNPARTLSGGNQQKLVVGKWLHRRPTVLLLDEPTRGIDIGAKAELYAVIRRLAESGLSVILVSSELEEVVDQSDRVLVLHRGKLISILNRGEATMNRVLGLIFAVEGQAA
jgi:ABC-type sugar transport system ATPase subunit